MTTLSELRFQIDELDRRLITLLAERAAYVQQVGELKTSDSEIVAEDRQKQVYQTRRAWASEQGLDPDFVEALYRLMVEHFIEKERQQLAERKNSGG
jgi:isochorismate pyruvate lyase